MSVLCLSKYGRQGEACFGFVCSLIDRFIHAIDPDRMNVLPSFGGFHFEPGESAERRRFAAAYSAVAKPWSIVAAIVSPRILMRRLKLFAT
jgi:hypothetical protein